MLTAVENSGRVSGNNVHCPTHWQIVILAILLNSVRGEGNLTYEIPYMFFPALI
jgi:hypothetical protein